MTIPIKWGGSDAFTHMLVVGATRSGKTATILKPIIYQLLLLKKQGVPLGLSVVEPKGDVAQMVADISAEMELPYTHIDPMKQNSAKFNPMEGETNAVAEATVIVLKGLFGKQDAFFATVQELSARNVTKLLKELHGDNMDITDVLNTLRDPNVLKQKVAELERKGGNQDLLHFFKSELLGSMADKYRQFVIGLRAQLENIVSNDSLRTIMTGQSSIDIDQHFEEGGILAVNTALGMLRSSGDAFGQFVIMHLQNATFRRPGTEDTRVPHFLIVDEYSRYINPDVEIFLSLAAEYRVAGIFAIQSLSQLEVESGKYSALAIKNSILTNCRNKLVFGGVGMNDAKEFADMFGQDKIIMRQSTYKNRILLPNLFPESYRDTEIDEYRFSATDIMDQLPRFTYVHQLVQDGKLNEPGIGLGTFIPREWKELREWEHTSDEQGGFLKQILKLGSKKNKKNETKVVFDLSEEEIKELEAETEREAKAFIQSETITTEEEALYTMEKEKYGTLNNYDQKEIQITEEKFAELTNVFDEPESEIGEQQEMKHTFKGGGTVKVESQKKVTKEREFDNKQEHNKRITEQTMPETKKEMMDYENEDDFW